jgi:hypothetical protein
MELVDNAFILLVPGALAAGLSHPLFWLEPRPQPRDRLRNHGPSEPRPDCTRSRSRGDARVPRPLKVRSKDAPDHPRDHPRSYRLQCELCLCRGAGRRARGCGATVLSVS